MTKLLVFLLFLLPLQKEQFPLPEEPACNCPEITNLQKTGETSNSISFSWNVFSSTPDYKLWYTRAEDQYTSANFYTSSPAYTFANLVSGTYTFYFVHVCGEEESSRIGVEDVVQN